jgi:predicted glycoside hydrolase/deacetylase ChbG (UPF0249 family)
MKRLIVNADDLGVGKRRNDGIVEAHLRGIVTATSVIVNGVAFDHAVDLLGKTSSLDAGLHLNLSEGRPVGEGYRTLVGLDGDFFGKEVARRKADEGAFDPEEIEREMEAQWKRLVEQGVGPSHIDSHQHIHIYGKVFESVVRFARNHGVRFVRLPDEPSDGTDRMEEYRTHVEKAKAELPAGGVDAFFGITLTGCMSRERILDLVGKLGEGVTELMVHPGYADRPDGFSGPDREGELQVLTDKELRRQIEEAGIEFVRFRDL